MDIWAEQMDRDYRDVCSSICIGYEWFFLD